MSDSVKVTSTRFRKGSNAYYLRWSDPLTGKRMAKSAGTTSKREGERAAAVLEQELREGKYAPKSTTTWRDFTWRYTDQVLPSLAPKTRSHVGTVFNTIERILNPKLLSGVTAARLSDVATVLQQEGKSPFTIRNYLAHLKAAMRWAVENAQILAAVPTFPKPKGRKTKRQKQMKGRPITGEEFDRMILAVPKIVGEQAADSWRFFLAGLWWSGLRLGEALNLSWDDPHKIMVDFSGRYPMLHIPGGLQKNGEDQDYPIAPEFAEMLQAVPEDDRRGRVFKLLGTAGPAPTHDSAISRIVSRIGTVARVRVDERTKRKADPEAPGGFKLVKVVKWASCHDFRRSFGERWADRVMPHRLMELMRHADIQTTMRFYVGRNAEKTAEAVWAAYRAVGNTLATTNPLPGGRAVSADDTTHWDSTTCEVHPSGLGPSIIRS